MILDLDHLIDKVRRTVQSHALDQPGAYARWLWQDKNNSRDLGPNEYGCADAANIQYILGELPRDAAQRQARIDVLRSFQNPEDGLFHEKTHHAFHSTAHCTAALELFEAMPTYPLTGFDRFRSREGLEELLAGLNWYHSPWNNSHQGAGVFAAMIITGNAPMQWQDWYFDWLSANTDPEYGMSLAGAIQNGTRPAYEHLNGWFHYMFNHHFAHRPFPQVEKLIDTCLKLYDNRELASNFGKNVGFHEIDWVFTLNRATMQTGYRFAESREALRDFAGKFIPWLESVDENTSDEWNDLHMLFGAVCAVAELQIALPGELRSTYPLRQILDRRPFI